VARIGIIGCGGMADAHLGGLVKMSDVELVGFCDVVEAKAEEKAARHRAPHFTDPRRMLAEVPCDAVYILLPPFAHGPAEHAAIEAGVPFFVEKPVGNRLEVCREVAAAVEARGLMTAVGYMNRYRRGVRRAHEVFAEDTPVLAFGGWLGGTPRGAGGSGIGSWWVDRSKSGGQFVEQVSHTVDLVRFLCGDAEEVYMHRVPPRTFNRDVASIYSIDDAATLSIRLRRGGVANIWSSCATGAGGNVTLTVYGGRHTAFFSGWEHSLRLLTQGQPEENIPGEGEIFAVEDRTFIDAVMARDPSRIGTPYADGLRTLELILAAEEAARTGRPVAL